MIEYSLRAMDLWFQHFPGSFLLECEREALLSWFSVGSGTHCLQIGGSSDLRLIQAAPYPYKVYLSTQFSSETHSSRIQFDLETLPILSQSVDAVVLAHLLEFSDSPSLLIEETYRILSPEGQLILLVFNPWSFLGLSRLLHKKKGFPWSGKFYSSGKIKYWLREVGYKIVIHKTLCFGPLLKNATKSKKNAWTESLGPYCFPGLGAVSLMIAEKREIGMTPIKMKVRRPTVKVGGRVIETSTYR